MKDRGTFRLLLRVVSYMCNASVGVMAADATPDPKQKSTGINPLYHDIQLKAYFWLASGSFYQPSAHSVNSTISKCLGLRAGDDVELFFDAAADQLQLTVSRMEGSDDEIREYKDVQKIHRPCDADGCKMPYCFVVTLCRGTIFTIINGKCENIEEK